MSKIFISQKEPKEGQGWFCLTCNSQEFYSYKDDAISRAKEIEKDFPDISIYVMPTLKTYIESKKLDYC